MLELKHISKSYKTADFTQVALDDVSVMFRDNEFVAILGPSGSGKTTMLNILGGLDHADSGDIVINGVSTKDYKSKDWDTYRNHRVGFIFQSYNLIPHQSVLSNVELALTLSGIGRAERRERAKRALEAVGLGDHVRKRPSQLSGGQMQRVAIARALVNDPDIVLADEPTGALDTQTSVQVMDILKDVARDRLVVMVTHNPELAEQYATRIVRVRDGCIEGDTYPIRPEELAVGAVAPHSPAAASTEPLDGKTMAMPTAAADASEGAEVSTMRHENRPPVSDARESGKSSRHASMSFLTALALSANNLMSKKGRTILTAFAGSIGIIGIAAILALSNGVNNYIAKTEQDALSSFPLTITQSSADITGLMMAASGDSDDSADSGDHGDAGVDLGSSGPSTVRGTDLIPESTMVADMFGQVRSNDLSAFKEYLESGESDIDQHVSTIGYKYGVTPQFYASDTSSKVTQLGSPLLRSMNSMQTAGMSLGISGGAGATGFTEMLDDRELLASQYDVVLGTWPQAADEAVLVLGTDGSISDYTLYCIGVLEPQELEDMVTSVSSSDEKMETPDTHVDFTYDDALAMTFKVVSPAQLYQYNAEASTWTDMSGDQDFMRGAVDGATTVKVVGVIRPSATARNVSLQEGIAYMHELTQELMAKAAQTDVVKAQLANPDVDVFTGKTFEELQSGTTSAFDMNSIFSVDEEALKNAFSFDSSALENAMDSGGGMDFSGLDLSGMDLSGLDMSNIDMSQVDTSALSSIFSPEAMQKLIQGAPQFDPSSLAGLVDPSQSQAVTETGRATAEGFVRYFMANAEKYATAPAGDGAAGGGAGGDAAGDATGEAPGNTPADLPVPSYDMEAAWNDYIATDEGRQLYSALTAAVSEQGQNLSGKVQEVMQDYIQNQFAPYFSAQMQQLMTQAAQVMAQQMGQALQTTIASATQSLGTQLSAAIAQQMQSQMGGLADALQSGFSVDADAFQNAIHFNLTQDDLTSLLTNYANASQLTYDNNLSKLGYADEAKPTEIDIYPKSFDDKEVVLDIIDDYNQRMKDAGQEDKVIGYTDMVGALLTSVTSIVNTISTVLIAFVSISLVVSSIMIAIITYISVLERKKEIGILRAMGASKLNVASIFNAETFIEGLISGVFAILVVLIAEVPVNAFVYNWRHVEHIMALTPQNALILICISVVLTLIAGLIPSSIAAKRDPVEALRSE